jgi:xylulokinase
MADLLLGIDFGTGGCKATLIDTDGELLAEASAEYPTSHPRPGWAEQNPADWRKALRQVITEVSRHPSWSIGKLLALALDSYTHGAVLLDEKLNVIRPTIIWTDQRSVAESEFLKNNHADLIFRTAYQMPAPTWTLPQMLWLRNNEPENFGRIRHLSFVKDYIRFLLTGALAVDHIEAQGTLFWDMEKRCWSEELCALASINLNALPPSDKPTALAGKVSKQAAGETGLPEGTPVMFGASDSAVEDYAAGALRPGQCIIKLATAGNVNVMTASAHPHPRTLTYSHVLPGLWYTVTATNAAAVCQRWFRDLFCEEEKTEAARAGINVYEILNRKAATSPVGANGVMFHPYLMGERSPYWDANLRGSFTGLSMAASKGDCCRALLEGVAFSLRDCFRTIEEMGLAAEEFILIGGGAKSGLWSRIICDVFNAPVSCPAGADASFGSALLAGVGVGIFADEKSAVEKCLRIDQRLEPEPGSAEIYAKLFLRYRLMHDAVATVYGDKD